ncbi:9434_t:CDS:2 [Funneliformis mosseae]|uniref:9434_t:CDS:1 n=1 Tax=Funneliformis mosseae TaxID=27381 RepID=A0A9N9G9P9_FUNMO|nr:9434_t:CDS:2 [Funneliformis mosseae]
MSALVADTYLRRCVVRWMLINITKGLITTRMKNPAKVICVCGLQAVYDNADSLLNRVVQFRIILAKTEKHPSCVTSSPLANTKLVKNPIVLLQA